ncbi:hypothetical protein [Puia dinghuensis]|nr:hypothetical protein [Puia dinghuensis]
MLIVGVISLWKKVHRYKPFIQKRVFTYLLFMAVMFFYIWSLDRQLFLFHRNKINKPVIGWLKDKRFPLTNDTIQYLGSTGKYVFCYDLKGGRSIIVNVSQFDRIEFGSYKDLPGISVFDMLYH